MSNWNYRVIEFKSGDETWRAIHEVHYDIDGKPKSYDTFASSVAADIFDGHAPGARGSLEWTLDRMREALDKPVLQASDFQDG